MKKIAPIIITLIAFSSILGAQEISENDAIRHLYSFSPLGEIFVRHLGMTDRNGNGLIDSLMSGYDESNTELVEISSLHGG